MNASDFLKKKWAPLVRREKTFVVIGIVLAVVALVDLAIYEPYAASVASIQKDLVKREADLASITKQRADVSAELDAITKHQRPLNGGSSILAGSNEDIHLWSGTRSAEWAAKTQQYFGEELVRMSVGSSGSLDGGYQVVFSHAVLFEVVTSWRKIGPYMESAKNTPAFRVEKMEFMPKADGLVKFSYQAKILSKERVWQDVVSFNPVEVAR